MLIGIDGRRRLAGLIALLLAAVPLIGLSPGLLAAAEPAEFVVKLGKVRDLKAVFATVEGKDVTVARSRIVSGM